MKRKTLLSLALIVATMATLTACRDREKIALNFNASIEQPDNGDAKTQLVNEKWIYWTEYDEISIATDISSEVYTGTLVNFSPGFNSEFNGVFMSTLDWGAKYFCALYPHRANNVIVGTAGENNFPTVTIDLPAEQPYANDTSFDHNVMPMVAWEGRQTASPTLDFHSLGGIVRLQIYNPVDNIPDMEITSIEISSNGRDNKQLKGLFNVVDYKTFDPHLVGTSDAVEDRTITITPSSGSIDFPANELLTFYLVLPALKGMDDSTIYPLTMTIHSTAGNCTKNFTVPIRRNGITYMRAIGIDDWYSGAAEEGLSGNGTQERPFKIYNLADLKKVRNAFHTTPVIINGQTVDENTWFRIMTSSIILNESTWVAKDGGGSWSTGIENFKGHMTFYGTNSSTPGITNNSRLPIFQSISQNSSVEGLTVKCDIAGGSSYSHSPLCFTNNGTIKDCHVTTPGSIGLSWEISAMNTGLAGICVNNEATGVIQGCGCSAKMACNNRRIAGICFLNRGTIKECYAASPTTGSQNLAERAPTRFAGICDTSAPGSVIQDCYFAARINNATYPCAGIVSANRGSVTHCYASENALIISSSSAAGIVGTNYDGTVDYCWSEAALRARYAGMIAFQIDGGKFINCFCNDGLAMITLTANAGEHYAGGLAAEMTSGSIENCFIYMSHINLMDNTGTTGGLVGKLTAGTVKNSYVYESYSPSHNLYGTKGQYATVENCHVVMGSGIVSGISNWTTEQLTNMQSALNSHIPTGGKEWEGAVNYDEVNSVTAVPPQLKGYVVTP